MFLQNTFITETYNYTKRILQSHTDHYPNNRATNWKKLTTEELNRYIACHWSTRTKNKRHMPVGKTHHRIVRGSIPFPIKRDTFSHGSQERFCYCPGCFLEVSSFQSHLHQFDPRKEHLYLLNRWQGRPNS
jgi:hypothetical protein